ncbi:MAG TPA: hypothetical protein VGB85_25545, partial [Nannocystis sp.]
MAELRSKTRRASNYGVGARLVVEKYRGGAVVPENPGEQRRVAAIFPAVNKLDAVSVRIDDRGQFQAENIPGVAQTG